MRQPAHTRYTACIRGVGPRERVPATCGISCIHANPVTMNGGGSDSDPGGIGDYLRTRQVIDGV